jgi:hypothetical protein
MTRVLHVLDHSLPLHSGYTFRTRAIMTAQAASGLEVRGITGQRQGSDGLVAEVADGLLLLMAVRLMSRDDLDKDFGRDPPKEESGE